MPLKQQLVNAFSLFANQTNVEHVQSIGEELRTLLESDTCTKEERSRILIYLREVNDWIILALHSPALKTLTDISPKPLRLNSTGPFGYFRANVHLDGETSNKRCIRLGGDEVFVQRRTIRDGLILGSVKEFVLGKIDSRGAISIAYPYQRFAVKNYMLSKLGGNTQENMIKELTVQKRLTETNNPYVLPLLEFVGADDRCMAIMPMLELGDAFDAVQRETPLEMKEIKSLTRSMLFGIQVMHTLGLAHRDISPENFLLKDPVTAVLMDFGLSIEMDEDWTVAHTGFVGKVAYSAPELWDPEGQTRYDARKIDVWSIGITVFAMVTRSLPWTKACAVDRDFWRKRNHIPLFLNHLPQLQPFPDLVDFLTRTLRLNPDERPRVDELLKHPFIALI